MKLSLLFPEETKKILDTASHAVRTEEQGFHGMWLGSAFGFDPFIALALAGDSTARSSSASRSCPPGRASDRDGPAGRIGQRGVRRSVPSRYRCEPQAGDPHVRHRLRPADQSSPRYLAIVQTLLADGRVTYDGERYQVNGFLDIADAPPPPVMLGVLREQAARLAGSSADGALCWLCPAGYVQTVIAPNLRARRRYRRSCRAAADCRAAVRAHHRSRAVHAMAAKDSAVYPHMPFYRGIFEAAGIEVAGAEWNDAMLDAFVLYGDDNGLAAKIQAFFDAGADEVVLSPFGVGDDPVASQAECIRVLSDLTGSD